MRFVKKVLFPISLLALLLGGCSSNKIASGYDPFNKNGINTEPGNFDFDGNFVKPEINIDGDDNDEAWTGPNVSQTLQFSNNTNQISVKLLRGNNSLFFFFRVSDKYINAKGNDNGDDVSQSDSVEIYIDSLNDGGVAPRTDDYQINLGVHDKTRILVGSGTHWSNWNGLCQYETKISGTLNDNSDVDTGYAVEGMIPWNQIGCDKNSAFGVAFGNVNKTTTEPLEEVTWDGLIFDGVLVEPQTPNNYITYSGNNFSARGISVDDISVKGVVVDENSQPINNATIEANGEIYHTDAQGRYEIPDYSPLNPLALTVSYTGYKSHKYTIHSADMILAGGDFTYDVQLLPGSGDDEAVPNYVYIGETSKKLIYVLTLEASRHDKYGLSLKLSIDNTKFDNYQQYELYIDTGSDTRTVTDDESWCIAFFEDKVYFIASDPKGAVTRHSKMFMEFTAVGNVYDIYIPYALLNTNKDAVIGYSFGIWDNVIRDWEPMNREGEYSLVENPSLYVRQNPDGTVIEDNTGVADYYNYAADTRGYVNLGTFAGKAASYVTFSKVTAKIDHTDASSVYVQFTTNKAKWRGEETIELFIDSGATSRTTRDGNTYIMVISTGRGKIKDFHSYSTPETQLNKEQVNIYMDDTHMLVKIPYTTLNSSLTQSTILGFSFGVFNIYANDWDGYAYKNKYVDPERPNQYVRVDSTNTIQE